MRMVWHSNTCGPQDDMIGQIITYHWNGNATILTTFSSPAAMVVVILTISGPAKDKNFMKMTFTFQRNYECEKVLTLLCCRDSVTLVKSVMVVFCMDRMERICIRMRCTAFIVSTKTNCPKYSQILGTRDILRNYIPDCMMKRKHINIHSFYIQNMLTTGSSWECIMHAVKISDRTFVIS